MKFAKNLLLIFVAFLGIFALVGCGKKVDMTKYAGTYIKEYEKYVGDETKETKEEFTLVLNADGTAKSTRGGETYEAEWKVDGDNFTFIEKFGPLKNEYTGTIKDGRIDMFNGDPKKDITLEIVFNKK